MQEFNRFLLEKLVCPDYKHPLLFLTWQNQLFCKECEKHFEIINSIPVLLPATLISGTNKDNFDYLSHYSKDATEFDYFEERHGATYDDERRVHEYISHNVPGSTVDILDVGCGRAWVARDFLQKRINVCSLDISIENPAKAIARYPAETHSGIVADAFFLPFKDGSFDCIVASEIIEHVVDPAGFVKELFKCLKPGGELIITTPYKEVLQYSLCIHCNQKTPHNAHLHSFDEKKLEALLINNGLFSFSFKTFGNKILLHLRTYVLLKFLPFQIWKMFDKLCNLIYNRPAHILVKYIKGQLK